MLVMSGLTNLEAYSAVYDTGHMAATTAYATAYDFFQKPLILAKLKELRAKIEAQSTLAPNITREFILNGIKHLAANAEKESTQLAAYQTLGKVAGIDLFRDIHVTEKVHRTVEDVERELKSKLTDLQKQLTIDGDARQVATPAPVDRRRKRKPGPTSPG